MGTGASDLDDLLAIIQKKERQAEELEALRLKAEKELRAKEVELAEARRKRDAERKMLFQEDCAKYQRIVNSSLVSDAVKERAWQMFCDPWGIDPDIDPKTVTLSYQNGKAQVWRVRGGEMVYVSDFGFYIDKYEVTNADYMVFVEETGHRESSMVFLSEKLPIAIRNLMALANP